MGKCALSAWGGTGGGEGILQGKMLPGDFVHFSGHGKGVEALQHCDGIRCGIIQKSAVSGTGDAVVDL